MPNKENRQEIKNIDSEGNTWRIVMYPLPGKTNRFQLSFCFNEKEFELTKLQSHRSAQDLWDLLGKIRKSKPESEEDKERMWIKEPPSPRVSSIPCTHIKEDNNHEQQAVNRSE